MGCVIVCEGVENVAFRTVKLRLLENENLFLTGGCLLSLTTFAVL